MIHNIKVNNLIFINPLSCKNYLISFYFIQYFVVHFFYGRNEFKKLSELFSEADFRPFITAVYHHHDREDIYEGDDIQEYAEVIFEL